MTAIDTATAHAAVRAANSAGKQVTVTFANGLARCGTARWQSPGDPACRVLMLFGSRDDVGPFTLHTQPPGPNAGYQWVTSPYRGGPNPYGGPTQTTIFHQYPSTVGEYGCVIIDLDKDQVTAITTSTTNDAALFPGDSNAADTTLGTVVNEYGYRQPDPVWQFGTGLE